MKKIILLSITLVFGFYKSQIPYLDILTAPAMILYGSNLKSGQQKTIDEMKNIQNKQTWLTSQLVLVNDVQNKVYKGLSQVNSIVSNGLQPVRIYKELEQML